MKATFDNSVRVLVKAYLDDTLEQGNCHACAIGNLVADANGFKFVRIAFGLFWENSEIAHWFPVHEQMYSKKQEQIDSTGYTLDQVARIEQAFECSTPADDGDWMFAGLMAVVDVLADIHNVDISVKEQAKALFVR